MKIYTVEIELKGTYANNIIAETREEAFQKAHGMIKEHSFSDYFSSIKEKIVSIHEEPIFLKKE